MDNKLTSCETCSKEVAKSAAICPHCGAKLKLTFIEKFLIFIFVSWGAVYFSVVIAGLIQKI